MARLISSPRTRYFKHTLPKLYFGFAAFFLLISLILLASTRDSRAGPFVILPIILGAFGYYIFKRFVFDLADEVYDEGDALVVKNQGREERIPLANIINVTDSVATNPPRITLTLRSPGSFGRDVTFSPPRHGFFAGARRNPIALELIDRIDAVRHVYPKT
jgi:hypothetical protein